MATNTKAVIQQNQAKFDDVLTAKSPSVIYSQVPPAGTAVPQGTVIEVRVFSPSDITLGSVLENVPPALARLSLDDIDDLVQNDPAVKTVGATGQLDPAQEAAFIAAFNQKAQGRGGTTTLPASEAQNVVKLLQNSGFLMR